MANDPQLAALMGYFLVHARYLDGDAPSLIDRDSAVANAVRSGDVAVRGQLASELGLGFSAFDRIEKRLSSEWDISVSENEARGREPGGKYVRYQNVEANPRDVQKWVHANNLPQWWREAQTEESPPSRRGAPPKCDWDAIRTEAFRLMDHHGEFSPDDPEWNAQARLEEILLQFCSQTFVENQLPGISTLREKIPGWLGDRRKKKVAGN